MIEVYNEIPINELRAKRLPNGVSLDEFDAAFEEYQTLNAKLPVGAKETGNHLTTSLIDLMPPEADERVALMRERIATATSLNLASIACLN